MKVSIGWDSREDISYQICKFSIEQRTRSNVEISPIKQQELREQGIYSRPIDNLGSTEFTFSRFFVPYLSNYNGWTIFCDCDFLWLCDIKELFDLADDRYAVQVVQHDYTPKEAIKMDGKIQHLYPRKNWSSMILWNCAHPKNRILDLDLLNDADKATGAFLHRFQWLDDSEIGSLNHKWNWLEDWYHEPEDGSPNVIHYTRGNVYFKDHQNVEYAQEWKDEFKAYSGRTWTDNDILDK